MKKKRKFGRKLLSLLLTLALVLGLMPGMGMTAKAEVSDVATPLTLEAKTAGTIVVKNPKSGMKYSVDDGEKTTVNSTDDLTINVTAGQKVSFYGNDTQIPYYGVSSSGGSTSITGGTAECYIYGNVMSLVNENGFANATALTEQYAFAYLFRENTKLLTHEFRQLVLPATTLTSSCYFHMFIGCKSLTTAPELPATTLANSCYHNMFYGCTGLTTAPELPATTLALNCYCGMFGDCIGLTTAPELPATTLASGCYSDMFTGCTHLTTAPELPATTLADSCYYNMFYGCTGLTTAPELPATTLASSCYYGMFYGCIGLTTAPELPATMLKTYCYGNMFYGCTGLTTAPELPATTLAGRCYYNMFNGCTSLNSVTCLATDISASNSTRDWLKAVASTGTFTKAADMTGWTKDSASGIPSGWTVNEAAGDITASTWNELQTSITNSSGNQEAPASEPTTIKLAGSMSAGDNDDPIRIDSGKNIILDLNGQTITGNETKEVIINQGTLKIIDTSSNKNGTICNGASGINNGGTLYFEAGNISGNLYSGICNNYGCSVILNGGKISGNGIYTSGDSGYNFCGIYNAGGTLTINGGEISGNKGNLVGGVLNFGNCEIGNSSAIIIKDNTLADGTTKSDVFSLDTNSDPLNWKSITASGALAEGSKIGIATLDLGDEGKIAPQNDAPLVLISGLAFNDETKNAFFSNSDDYEIGLDESGNVLLKVKTLTATHSVTVTAGSSMTKTENSGAASQTGLSGAMTDVVYTADEGYYFPENYSVEAVNGISVTRNSYTQITVSGTPSADAEIALTAPTAKTTPDAPTTAAAENCTTADNNDGKLTGVTTAMEYKKSDATVWTAGTGSDITGLVPGTYYVRVKATDTTNASANQELTIADYLFVTKTAAKAELDTLLGTKTESDYDAADWTTLTQAIENGKTAIDNATSTEAVTTAKNNAVDAVNAVKTKAQKSLDNAKTSAKADLDTLLTEKNQNDYDAADWTTLTQAITAGKTAIDNATTTEAVTTAKNNAVDAVNAVKTKAQKALENAKTTAKNDLDTLQSGKNQNDYDAADWTTLTQAITAGKTAIDNATTTEAVTTAKNNAIDTVNAVKTKAQKALDNAKTSAVNTVNAVNANDYIAADQQTVTDAKTTALAAIEAATTEEEVTTALNNFNNAIASCTTQVVADQIAQVMSEVSAKTGSDMTYTGSPIQLINTPTTALPAGYTMKYAVTTENVKPTDESLYTTEIPTKTEVGTYYVWYKVVGDINDNDSKAVCITVVIKPQSLTDASVTVDTKDKTVTVKNDRAIVPAEAYHVIYFAYKKIEGGESLKRVGTDFPKEYGEYIAAVVANENSGYTGENRSEPFAIGTTGSVSFNQDENSDETVQTAVKNVESSNLSDFAEELAEEGKFVKVELEITPKKEEDIAQTSVDGTKQIAEGLFVGLDSEKIVTEYFEIDLTKYVDNKDAGNIHDTGSPIEIALKYDKTKMFDPVVVRTHNGETKAFDKLSARPVKADYKDATYYVGDGVIYIYSRYFSDYAIIYSTVKTYNVDIVTGTGDKISKTVAEGSKAGLPTGLLKSGYTFGGWYSDEACTKVWKEDDAVTADITIYAKWTKDPAPTQVPTTVPTSAPTPVPTSAPVTTPTATPTPTVAPTVTPAPVKNSITAEEVARGAIKLNAGFKVYPKNSDVVVKWGKVDNADRYVIYAAYCKKGRKCAKIATVDSDVNSYKFSELNGKPINTKKNIKLYVVAYRKVNGKYKKITSSITAHIVGSGSKKYSNVKGIKVESTKITLSLDDNTAAPSSYTLNPVAVLKDSSKKMLLHTAEFRYASSKSSVATVGKDGTVTAKGKGTCYIYVYAQNGYAKKVKVTVK